MNTATRSSPSYPTAAILSVLCPGLGLIARGQIQRGLTTIGWGGLLLGCSWAVGFMWGTAAAIFFGMMVILPWWGIQSYEAYLHASTGFKDTIKMVLLRAHDIRYLGGLFLLTAFTDFYIIVANPEYSLTLFCNKPEGIGGILAKAQSPALHLAIGYGFLRLRRWSLLVYLAYAGFGILNATVNYACLGYGRIRTVFLVTLIGFTLYVWWRRKCFRIGSARAVEA